MPKTYCHKVIDRHLSGRADDGPYCDVAIDALLGHDATIGLLIDAFRTRDLKIWDSGKVLFANDHFSSPASIDRAEISNRFIDFARQEGVEHLMIDRGICHQVLVEHALCQPGSLILGADSHTIMAGGLGACATGMGSTDICYALATGRTWLRRPESIKVVFKGRLPTRCSGRDIALMLMSVFGEDGASYRCLEFHDETDNGLCQDDRFSVANMAVETGAKFGVFVPDAITRDYCRARDGADPAPFLRPDADAPYVQAVDVDLSRLSPLVAAPWSPANVAPLTDHHAIPVTRAFIGSCAGGRLRDLEDAANELRGEKIHANVRFTVIPASMAVYREALKSGIVESLLDSGAVFNAPSCGPCGGIDKGVLGRSDVCVSTSNRNFRGRMGHWESRTYLASARTVARAARLGVLDGAPAQVAGKETVNL